MPMKNGQSVGDMIVQDRKRLLKVPGLTKASRENILSRPAPRSMRDETWPPTKAERTPD